MTAVGLWIGSEAQHRATEWERERRAVRAAKESERGGGDEWSRAVQRARAEGKSRHADAQTADGGERRRAVTIVWPSVHMLRVSKVGGCAVVSLWLRWSCARLWASELSATVGLAATNWQRRRRRRQQCGSSLTDSRCDGPLR